MPSVSERFQGQWKGQDLEIEERLGENGDGRNSNSSSACEHFVGYVMPLSLKLGLG